MCLILLDLHTHAAYPLTVAANRDESYARPATPAAWWPDAPGVLAGRDLLGGGTWMGVARDGRWAAVTNVREPTVPQRANAPSRGALVADFLRGSASPAGYAAAIASRAGDWNGFNLLVGDADSVWWLSNRAPGPVLVEPGAHGVSNALLDTPWPKVVRGRHDVRRIVGGAASVDEELFRALALREPAPDAELPDTGVGREMERALSSPLIVTPGYGTRASTVLRISASGEVTFAERTIDPAIGSWTEARHRFTIHR
ncbi:MAG TPA: NRDE family protein [Longimicrobium sp.]|nr:NRDE family protein [Longimicrobium sp.]